MQLFASQVNTGTILTSHSLHTYSQERGSLQFVFYRTFSPLSLFILIIPIFPYIIPLR